MLCAAELREAVRGEVRFDDGDRAMYATDASNYRQVPIGVVLPRDAEDVERRGRRLPAVRRADRLARRRDEPGRRDVQRGGRHRLQQVHEPHRRRSIGTRKPARVQPGCVIDDLRNAAEDAALDVRARSRDPQPQHARRHDRQQLVRHARADGRQDRRERRGTRDRHLRRAAHARRPDVRRGTRTHHRRGRPARRDLRAAQGAARQIRRSDPRAVSRRSRGAFRAIRSTSSCPRTASTSRARSSAPRARA